MSGDFSCDRYALDYPLVSALLLGLLSTLHCVGMCGGIMGALAFSLPGEVRADPLRLSLFIGAYNAGRLSSYALAGAVMGSVGQSLYLLVSPRWGYSLLQWAAALLLIATGLYLGGWFPRLAIIERIGVPFWRLLEPLGRKLIPVRSPLQAYGYGLVWGWLPCGLAYTALLFTVTAGNALQGALFMVLFGLGTLPAVMGIGILAERLRRFGRGAHWRKASGILLIALALAGVFFTREFHAAAPLGHEQQEAQCRDERLPTAPR